MCFLAKHIDAKTPVKQNDSN